MTDVINVNPMAVAALVEADRIKVHDVSRAQDYTLTLAEVFDTMAADASSLASIATYVSTDAGVLEAAATYAAADASTLATLEAAIVANTKALANALQASFKDGLLSIGTLAISGTLPEDFKTTTTAYTRKGSIQYSKAAEDDLDFTAAGTINTAAAAGQYWGIWLVQIVPSTGVISTKAPSVDQVYASTGAALAALPAVDTGNVALGHIRVQSKEATAWIANTDDMTPASDCAAVTFTDATPLTAFTASAVA